MIAKIDHILVNEAGVNNFKKTQVMQSTFSDHNELKREISNRKMQDSEMFGN